MIFLCDVCQVYKFDSSKGDEIVGIKEGVLPKDFPETFRCPVCSANKTHINEIKETHTEDYLTNWKRDQDKLETHMVDIHMMAETGKSIIEPMRTTTPVISWDDILIKGAQLAKLPLEKDVKVNIQTVIGPKARYPLVIEAPVYISHMSFGALSKNVKIALAKGSCAVKTAMCSGEGGILPESINAAYKYIFEYVPNEYSLDQLKNVHAVEIKFGQSTKPGMGGHLPGNKVTAKIAKIRGIKEGEDIISPSTFKDIKNKDDLRKKVTWLRKETRGKPIGIKIAAGNIEADLDIAIFARPDFITIDGRPGATGASGKMVKLATSVPTLFALSRAKKYFNKHNIKDISLIITGGLRVSSDFAKALALGADAIAIGTSALIACACQQYRICDTGQCPVGVATHDPELTKRLHIEKSARRLENFLRASIRELEDFARLTGNDDVHKLSVKDLCTTNSEISNHTDVEHV